MTIAQFGAFDGLDAASQGIIGLQPIAAQVAHANVSEASALLIRKAMLNHEGAHRRNEPRVPNASNFPNIVTGTLRRSIRSSGIARTGPSSFEATVGPTAIYGRRVELGYHGKGSYPFFGPAVKETLPLMSAIAAKNAARLVP
ncbi:hypothetical protein SEA_SONALI_15 [Arthrobacter phage Sonali]|uniref:Uncharacterized protein n=1 Tax=Arthrobacter phage Sonali TaxID=2510495 RepID=A0A411CQP5_9CAUD|nr:hypothetical protein HOV09_gp15 [Arthrobacter phage Sonali]QAY16127.1 hypothetical protein SEA_SONALI_15 [Arthrobacter phage Sonali]